MKKILFLSALFLLLTVYAKSGFAHCEIPCGIYDDEMRISMIEEDIETIEKSMNQITELSKEDNKNYNQIVRWVQNKEEHATELMHIVTQYFMTQRIKSVDQKDKEAYAQYQSKLSVLHQMLIYAMKSKQTTNLSHVEKLRSLAIQFRGIYFKKTYYKK